MRQEPMSIPEQTRQSRLSSNGWKIQRIAKWLDREMDRRLIDHGITVQQFAVMMTVLETDGLSQTQIGRQFSAPAYTISRAIDHLERAGLLDRRPHPTSRRTHTIHATAAGHKLSPALLAIVQEVNAALVAPLDTAERDRFSALLTKLT